MTFVTCSCSFGVRSSMSIFLAAISSTRYSMYSSLVRYVVVLSLDISIHLSPLNLYNLFGKLSTLTKRSPFSASGGNCIPNSALACLSNCSVALRFPSTVVVLEIIFFLILARELCSCCVCNQVIIKRIFFDKMIFIC